MYSMANYSFDDESSLFSNKRMKNNQGQSVNVTKPNVPPSCVVHVRGLSEHVTDTDLIQALQGFGTISYVMNFPQKRMALVEYEDLESAVRLVNHTREKEVPIGGMPAFYNFSRSDKIKRPDVDKKSSMMEVANSNVILLTIMNARHPITVEVIHAICSPLAEVIRIVIFRKNGVQVLVEFENFENATKAKNGLHGADIYANSCTIKAEYAKPTKLTVRRNDANNWDYTATSSTTSVNYQKSKPLLADPNSSTQHFGYGPFNPLGSSASSTGVRANFDGGYGDSYGGGISAENQFQVPNCVLMIYGINMEKFNCQKLFNLLCLYGDVLKIRFLKSKEGSAMVQMAGKDSCERVLMMLRDVVVFGKKLAINNSKQSYVSESTSPPFSLPDGSNSFMDFTGSKNNRFGSPDALKKHKVQFPTRIIYFYNAPPSVEEEVLLQPFKKCNAELPQKVVMLPAKSEKSSRGYMMFHDAETATESLVAVNNSKLPNPNGPAPYVMKLAFSAASPDEAHQK